MSSFGITVNRIIASVFAVVLIPFYILTGGIDLISAADRPIPRA